MQKRKLEKKKGISKTKKNILNLKKEISDVDIGEDVFLKSSFSVFEVSIITLIAILFGVIIGYLINYTKSASLNKNLNQIVTTYNKIVDNYYGDINEEKLSNAAIKGMVDSLGDPYSNYMDADMASSFNQMIDGEFVGIGIVVSYTDDGNVINSVIKDSPSEKAGLKEGDIIVAVDDTDLLDAPSELLVSLIKGKIGTKVKITVKRDNDTLSFNVKRANITVSSISRDVYPSGGINIGYIKIDVFAANTASQFSEALKSLEKENIGGLIIDVRDNPGGHLTQARKILSNFFDKQTVLYQIETKGKKKKVYSMTNETRKYPVAILVNSASASAAEVLAACFKDNYNNAIVVGETSYGKGTIQKSERLSNGTSIKYTTDKWLTSKGNSLNEVGIKPDYEVKLDYDLDLTFENDNQLQTALSNIRIVNEMKSAN